MRNSLGWGSEAGEGLAPCGSWWQGLAAMQASVGTQWWIQLEKPELNLEGWVGIYEALGKPQEKIPWGESQCTNTGRERQGVPPVGAWGSQGGAADVGRRTWWRGQAWVKRHYHTPGEDLFSPLPSLLLLPWMHWEGCRWILCLKDCFDKPTTVLTNFNTAFSESDRSSRKKWYRKIDRYN